MPKVFVLIDFQNVQPKALPPRAKQGDFAFYLFTGPASPKPEFEFAGALQALGIERVRYETLKQGGPQCIDLHIAYNIGQLRQQHPSAHFYVISKDKGFDSLIQTLKDSGVTAGRHEALTSVPGLAGGPATAKATKAAAKGALKTKAPAKAATPAKGKDPRPELQVVDPEPALAYLKKTQANKPRTRKTLQTALESHLKKTHTAEEVSRLIEGLIHQKHICDTNGLMIYLAK